MSKLTPELEKKLRDWNDREETRTYTEVAMLAEIDRLLTEELQKGAQSC